MQRSLLKGAPLPTKKLKIIGGSVADIKDFGFLVKLLQRQSYLCFNCVLNKDTYLEMLQALYVLGLRPCRTKKDV